MTSTGRRLSSQSIPNRRSSLPATHLECLQRLEGFIKSEKFELAKFYDDNALNSKATTATNMVNQLLIDGCGKEIAKYLAMLTLYDIVVLIDDSSSMEVEEGGLRIKNLKDTLSEITSIYDLANPEGILSVRFLNSDNGKKNVNYRKAETILNKHIYRGVTRVGTELQKKVLDRFVWNPKYPMKKPLIVMVITDGAIEGERKDHLQEVIMGCVKRLRADPAPGRHAVAFQFCHVGNGKGETRLYQKLDSHIEMGEYVDYIQMATSLADFSDPEQKWTMLTKLLTGAISKYWDHHDEVSEGSVADSEGSEERAQ